MWKNSFQAGIKLEYLFFCSYVCSFKASSRLRCPIFCADLKNESASATTTMMMIQASRHLIPIIAVMGLDHTFVRSHNVARQYLVARFPLLVPPTAHASAHH